MNTILNYAFEAPSLLQEALTHASVAHGKNYERMEFLGDRVLGLIISDALYRRFPAEPEGHLAKRLAALVQGSMLADIARSINLGDHIVFSDAEKAAGGADNDNILSDVFESVIGAMYLDGGLEPCRAFLLGVYETRFNTTKKPPQHPKTIVQEWAQGQSLDVPTYTILDRSGPDHAPIFTVEISVKNHAPQTAQAASRQAAEKAAAMVFARANGLIKS